MNRRNIVIIDVETSGPNIFENDLLSLFMCDITGTLSLELYVHYDFDLKWGSIGKRYFNKYKDTWKKKSIPTKEAILEINNFLEQTNSDSVILSGHNVSFDYYFLKKLERQSGISLSKRLSHRLIDTHSIISLEVIQGKLPQYALKPDGAAKYFNIPTTQRHSAKSDALLVREILIKLIDRNAHETLPTDIQTLKHG